MTAPTRAILFLSQAPPWPRDAGGNIRSYHVLAALAANAPVTLVTTAPPEERRAEARTALEALGARVRFVPDTKSRGPLALARTAAVSLFRGLPLIVRHNYNPLLAAAAREEWQSGRYAWLHLNHIDTAQYARREELSRAVIDSHNLLYEYFARVAARERPGPARLLHAREARVLSRYEREAFAAAARVLVCSEKERASLRALDPAIDARVVPNGADCDHFHPSAADPGANPPVLVFVGDMAYGPNDDGARFFASEVLPLLRARIPGVRFAAVGKNPSPALRALAKEHPDVLVTGFVDDVREHVWRARLCVVPIRYGAGTRLKVLEAFALGMPTVSTTIGAEGIDYEHGGDILIADGARDMAAAIERLCADRELYDSIRATTRRTALARYDWRVVAERLLAAWPDDEAGL